jgi:hypothetical protein
MVLLCDIAGMLCNLGKSVRRYGNKLQAEMGIRVGQTAARLCFTTSLDLFER